MVSTSSGKLPSKIFSSVRITGCLQRWNDCGTLSRARWQPGQGYKWDLLRMSEDHFLFSSLSCRTVSIFHARCKFCFLPLPVALSLSLCVFFLTLSHCLYRMFKCTPANVRGPLFVYSLPCHTVFTECLSVLSYLSCMMQI